MSPVARLVVRRVVLAFVVGILLTLLLFLVVDLAPGDPAISALGTFASGEARQAFIEEHGLDAPVWIRFPSFLGDLLQGELGDSLVKPESVAELIGTALPVTIQLTTLAAVMAGVASLLFGALAAVRRRRATDTVVTGVATAGLSAPDFWVGLMAIQLFAVTLAWLPAGGYVPPSAGIGDWLRSLLLPSVVLAIPLASALTRVVRASLAEEMDKDYVRTLRGARLSTARIVYGNVLRNAALAPLTVLGIRVGYLLSGAIIVESIFALPGMGRLLVDAVNQGDLSVVLGVGLVGALFFVFLNLLVDLLYLALNPRLRPTEMTA